MKKIVFAIAVMVCAVLFVSAAFAAGKAAVSGSDATEGAWWFKPSLSVGYAFDIADSQYTFTNRGVTLIGAAKMEVEPPSLSGIYIAGEFPFAVTDRFKLALGGSWTPSFTNDDMREGYNNSPILNNRKWDVDNNYGVTADFLASYVVLKNLSFIKDVAVVAGVRWDYHSMSFDEPTSVGILSAPGDTMDLSMYTLAPVFGLTSTFKGFKSGIFGGDMSLGILAGPIVFGHVNYKERFGNGTLALRSDDDFGGGYLLKVFGEITALSGKITKRTEGSLSIFAQYTRTQTGSGVEMRAYSGGTLIGTAGYDFDANSDVMVVGLKAAVTF
jgi:hypothetical protein